MKFFSLAAIGLLAMTAHAADPVIMDPMRQLTEQAAARVKPALVQIRVVTIAHDAGREVKNQASGTGFIITKKGHVVTNYHVAGRATRMICVFADNHEVEATLVGADPLTDLAVLLLAPSSSGDYPTVEFGDSSRMSVGDTVLAVGCPLAMSLSVTRGILCNMKMTLPHYVEQFNMEGELVGTLVRWFTHDAQIYPGNSGGPLINLAGKVIGVNEISFGLGGAIPGNLANDIAQQLIAHGKITRGWLGLDVQPLLRNSSITHGVLVSSIVSNSPAAQAGILPHDILLRLDGQETTVQYAEEIPLFNQMICQLPVGKEVTAVILRDGHESKVKMKVAEREPASTNIIELKEWGLTVRNVSALAAREMRLGDHDGVLVTTVRPNGPCSNSKPALYSGVVIREVNGQPIHQVSDLIHITDEIIKDKKSPVPVLVTFGRQKERVLTVVEVGIRQPEAPGMEARKAWLPVAFQAITREMAEQLGSNSMTGVRITQVYPETTAAAAGLKAGDLIIALDGEKIPVFQSGEEEIFTSRIRQYRAGTKPTLHILRDKAPMDVTVELARSPQVERELAKYHDPNFEFTVRDLTFYDKFNRGLLPNENGIVVIEVISGSWAALGGLAIGDWIQAIDNQPVVDTTTFSEKMKTLATARPKQVILRVQRGTHTRFIELEPIWDHHVPNNGIKENKS